MSMGTKLLGLGAVCGLAVALAAGQTPPANNKGGGPPGSSAGAQPGRAGQQGQAGQTPPRFDAGRFLKDHDKNNDGKLSKDELPAAARADFDKIDTNKDGSVSQDELQKYAETMARQRPQLVEIVWYAVDVPEEPATARELQAAYDELRKVDKNHDGKIDEGELRAFREQRSKERLDGIFQALDKNHDGKISKDEARGLWADNFSQLDKNGDGTLDRQEVEAACRMHHGGNAGGNAATTNRPNK